MPGETTRTQASGAWGLTARAQFEAWKTCLNKGGDMTATIYVIWATTPASVEITSQDEGTSDPPVRFRRSENVAVPHPIAGGSIDSFAFHQYIIGR